MLFSHSALQRLYKYDNLNIYVPVCILILSKQTTLLDFSPKQVISNGFVCVHELKHSFIP